MMGQFRLHLCKGMSDTATLHALYHQVTKCSRKLAIKQVGSNYKVTGKRRLLLIYFLAGLLQAMEIVLVDQMILRHLFFAN